MSQVAEAMFWVCQLAPSANPKKMGKGDVIYRCNHKTKYNQLRQKSYMQEERHTKSKVYSTIVYKAHMPNVLCIILLEVKPISGLIERYSIIVD
jgi:hypothetical protein